MFEQTIPVFIYCVSPLHMGAGTAIGVIDNPIQRERHTEYPMIAGSGLKGAIRHDFCAQAVAESKSLINRVFGPEPGGSSEHAGALSLSDAQLVTFPVRCVKNAFVYATSLTAIARVERVLGIAGLRTGNNPLPPVNEGECLIVNRHCLTDNKLILESFEFTARESMDLQALAAWLSENALPEDSAFVFFRDKIKSDLVVLPEEDFSYFVRNATVVEPHVRISDVSGTAEEGGLFYTENLPPETLLLSLAMASRERYEAKKGRELEPVMSSEDVMSFLLTGKTKGNSQAAFKGIDKRMIQIGGDATTGRGQVFLKAVRNEGKEVSNG